MQATQVAALCGIMRNRSPMGFGTVLNWWRASDLNLADGASVGDVGATWTDRVGGSVATQTIAANRPTFVASAINGKPVVQFISNFNTSVIQFLNFIPVIDLANDLTTVIVLRFSGIVGGAFEVWWSDGTGGSSAGISVSPSYRGRVDTASGGPTSLPVFTGLGTNAHAIFHKRVGTTHTMFYNISESQSAVLAGTIIALNKIGNSTTSFGAEIIMQIAELINFSGLTDAAYTDLYNTYLKPRYALP